MAVKKIQRTESAYSYPLLIKNLLKNPLTYSPRQEIVYRDRFRYDYEGLNHRICRLANGLKNLGVNEGDTVAVMDWDSHRYLEAFFAVPMMGAVLHTINIRLPPEQLIYTINHAEDDVILVHNDFVPLLESIMGQLKTVKRIILLSDNASPLETTLSMDDEYENLLLNNSKEYDFPDFDEDAMATTFYTTGTTGLPKGVYYSHRQIVLHTYALMSGLCVYRNKWGVDGGDVYMPLTPMFHVHAWGMPYLFTMMGNKQVYPGRYDPETILKLIKMEAVTFSHCVPTIIHMVVNDPNIGKYNLSKWKVVIGGAALPRGLCRSAMDLGVNIVSAYGMSETCPLLTVANLKCGMDGLDREEEVKIRCKTGLPVPNVELKIIDPDGNPAPHDGKSTGEIVVRSPWLTQGYIKDPEKSEELWAGGWLHTGDIGNIDREGYLQITDRMKDVIKTGGEWISSLELEDVISQHPSVSEVAVIGVKDDKWGERPLALVVLKEEYKNETTEKEIVDFCLEFVENGIIPKYGAPDQVLFMDAIAKTSVGKLNKKLLREQYQ